MSQIKVIAKNPTAHHNYSITDTIEAGIVLTRNRNKIHHKWKSQFKRKLCKYKKWRNIYLWYAY